MARRRFELRLHGGIVRVLVEEKAGEKVLGFEYIKPDAPIRPRDPEDTDAEGEGPDDGDGVKVAAKTGAAKPRAKRGPRKARGGRQRTSGPSLVPKVPLGSK